MKILRLANPSLPFAKGWFNPCQAFASEMPPNALRAIMHAKAWSPFFQPFAKLKGQGKANHVGYGQAF
jgi:hypothetical protein